MSRTSKEDLPDVEIGDRTAFRPSGGGKYRFTGAYEIWRGGKPGEPYLRIQSYTTGGQILISESTRQAAGPILKFGKQMEVRAKGIEHPITLSEVVGISGSCWLLLPEVVEALLPLADEIPLRYEVVEGAQLGGEISKGGIIRLSFRRRWFAWSARCKP